MKVWTEVVFQIIVGLLISTEEGRSGPQLFYIYRQKFIFKLVEYGV